MPSLSPTPAGIFSCPGILLARCGAQLGRTLPEFPPWSVEFRRFRCRVKSGRLAARFLTPRHSSAGASLRCVPVARNAPNARFSGFGREKRAYVARVARNARLRAGFSLRIRAFGADLAIHRRKSAHLACFSPHSPRFLAERQHARTLCAELASTKRSPAGLPFVQR